MRIVFLLAFLWIQTFRASTTTAATTTAATTTTPAPTTKTKLGKFNSGTGQNERGKVHKAKCKYKGKKYKAGSIIKLTTGADGCTRAILKCKKVRGKGKIRLEVENNCQCPICPTTTETTMKTPTANTSTTTTADTVSVARLSGTIYNGWTVGSGRVDAIEFTSSKDIHIHGISLFGSYGGSSTDTARMEMKEGGSVLTSQQFQYTSDWKTIYYDQMFATQGYARAGVKYTLTVEYRASARIRYAMSGVASWTVLCNGAPITFNFTDSSDDTSNGNGYGGSSVSKGQIPQIIFAC